MWQSPTKMSNEVQTLEMGNYRVLQKDDGALWLLGKGSYGTTYKAEHKHLRRICALKVINDHLVRNDQAKVRFLQEAQAAASLDHEHIARIYDFGEANGLFYYAMTYCAGGDLEEYAARVGAQPWSVVKQYAKQILTALGSAHERGLLHRDLKPSNIMLTTAEEPPALKLIDFGLVKALGEEDPSGTATMRTQEGSFMGNPLTASPEQFREEDLDERSDLYSVGVTLWYLLVGGSPFGKSTSAQIAHQRLTVENYNSLLPQDLDPHGRQILNRLLATDREQRFRYASEVLAALDAEALSEAPAEKQIAQQEDFDEIWGIEKQIRQFEYGTYYSCRHKTDLRVPPATLFIPAFGGPSFDQVISSADRLLGASRGALSGFHARGRIDGAIAYLCNELPSGSFLQLIQNAGKLTLQNDTDFIVQVADSIDQVMELGIAGLELGDAEILVGLEPSLGRRLTNESEWQEYLTKDARSKGGATSGLQALLLPRLGDDGMLREASTTIGGDDLATNPVARFGAFLYRVLSGMSVKQSAYLTSLNHVSFSDISEESNRYLAEVIAAVEEPGSAREVIIRLCELEGCLPSGWDRSSKTASKHPDPSVTLTAPIPIPQKPKEPQMATAPMASQVISAAEVFKSAQIPAATPATPPKIHETPSKPATPRKQNRKLLVAAIATVFLLLAGAGAGVAWYVFGNKGGKDDKDENLIHLPKETGSGTLKFPKLTIEGSKSNKISLALKDAKGVMIGTFDSGDKNKQVEDFPLDVFDDSTRWPLEFVALDTRYLVEGPSMRISDFTDKTGSEPIFSNEVKLRVVEYVDVSPNITLGGKEIPDLAIISPYIEPKNPNEKWMVVPSAKGLRVLLEPGGSFPVMAIIAVPGIKRTEMQIKRDDTPSANLDIEERVLNVNGLGVTGSLRFEPDISQIAQDLREVYSLLNQSYQIEARDLMAKRNRLTLPKLPGSIVVKEGSREGRVLISHDSQYLVLAGLTNRLEVEDQELVQLRELAEQGKVISQYRLAIKYSLEHTGDLASKLAYGWAKLAAEAGDPPSQYTLGIFYQNGVGIARDEREAALWFSRAAENGHGGGMSSYGWCFRDGFGVEADDKKAEEWFLKSAKKGDLNGMNNLGLLYGDGDSDLFDQAKSVEWLHKASAAGSVDATFNLGITYQNGLGVDIDLIKAKEFYKQAADKGHVQAKEAFGAIDQ